jgi:thioredoxin 1
MTIRDLGRGNFTEVIAERGVVVVDVTTTACGACAAFDPIFARVAERFPDLLFGKIEAEKEADLVSELAISHIPCLIIYRDEFLLFKQSGIFSESQLEELISTALSMDMERLRASISGE